MHQVLARPVLTILYMAYELLPIACRALVVGAVLIMA